MPSTKLLKERIESIQDTMKITNAMYLISSSKLRKARKNYQAVSPYFERMQMTMTRVRQKTSAFVRQFRTDPSGVMDEIQASGKLSPEQVQTILNAWNAFAGGDAHAIH